MWAPGRITSLPALALHEKFTKLPGLPISQIKSTSTPLDLVYMGGREVCRNNGSIPLPPLEPAVPHDTGLDEQALVSL